ncbi:MerR family transcriptional regulator [Paenibacillus woosongensis]|uniref:MerR family transcriptional regulator n=1 Tax=Paenibacillus woosongensis TaxID=307580 RepID=A0A7X2Z5H2_9BACL|nr:MerR family transcriptional regulator [Paenibacillus woosongensis]
MYSVGQLSKLTKVSIRTLHYYEKLGLLNPVRGENNQYRQYGDWDIFRLQQIAILKRMNFKLSEIAVILELNEHAVDESSHHAAAAWTRSLEEQLSIVRKQQEDLRRVEQLLFSAIYSIRVTGQVNLDEMLHFIKELDQPKDLSRSDLLKQVFSPEELDVLPIGKSGSAELEWADILKEINSHLHEAPDSDASQKLAKRIIDYASLLFNGDEQLGEKYWEYIAPEDGQSPRVYGMSSEVMLYIEKILEQWG